MKEILLLLGGNEGEPAAILTMAENSIEARIGKILARSRDHWTEPWGFEDERLFLNRALILASSRPTEQIMDLCLQIEQDLGRIRTSSAQPGPRPIDIDILLVGEEVIASRKLKVPHPRMHLRPFALAPAADIAPEWTDPLMKRTILFMLHRLRMESTSQT